MFNKKVVKLAKEDKLQELLKEKIKGELFLFYEALIIGEYKTVTEYNFNEMGVILVERLVVEFEVRDSEVSNSTKDSIVKILDGNIEELVTNRGNKKCMTAKKILSIVAEVTNVIFERDDIVESYDDEENTFIGYGIRTWR